MVLIVSYSGLLGGAERLLLFFAAGLESGCAVACPPGPLAEAARAAGMRVFELAPRGLQVRGTSAAAARELAGHALELRRLARDLRPELLIAWGMRTALASLLGARPACPVLFQHNDLLPAGAIGRAVRATAARADAICTLSEAIARDLDPHGDLRRLHVVHPGVEIADYPDAQPAHPPEVLVLAAIAPWKRPDLALEAFAVARRTHPELRLRVVGAPIEDVDAKLLSKLKARAAQDDLAGAVEFAGATLSASSELARASCLLHCAEQEPFGMAVLEALAAGRPAVVPAAAGPAEIVDPSCGVLYPPGDAQAAGRALAELLDDLARASRMGAAGRVRAQSRFAAPRARERYATVVRGLLPPAASRSRGRLALVTVSHNSEDALRALLASSRRFLPGVPVVVVDCASNDRSVAVAHEASNTVVLELGENVGFGRACNRGVALVDEDVTALVNPDVELLDDSLLELAAEAERSGRLLAPAVVYPDGTRQDSVHPAPLSVAELTRSLVPYGLIPGRLGVRAAPWRSAEPRAVGWAVGAALVARTETLKELGPFDERLFLYGEDLELGLRAAEAGVETWFWPQAHVLHHRAHSSRTAFGGEPFERLARARHDAVAMRFGARRARLDDAAQAATFVSRAIGKRLLRRDAARELAQLRAVIRARS